MGLVSGVNACASGAREGPALQERAWPVYLGTPQRVSGAESLAADPQPVWRISVARGITGAPALAEDVVAVSLVDRRVALLDRATGQEIWTRRLGLPIGAGPLIADDRLFVAEQTEGGKVYALRLSNGGTVWDTRVGDTFASLALADQALFVATREGEIGRLSAQTGEVVWRSDVNGAVRAAPLVTEHGLLIATQSDSLYLLDRETGAIRVRRGTRGAVIAAPALWDSLIVAGTSTGRLEALDAATLATRWVIDLGDVIVGSVAVRAGKAYALTGSGLLAIVPLDAPDGARRLDVGVASRAGPAPAARGVYIGGVNGEIVLIDSSGTRLWTGRIEPPVNEAVLLEAHTLLAVSLRGHLVLYR